MASRNNPRARLNAGQVADAILEDFEDDEEDEEEEISDEEDDGIIDEPEPQILPRDARNWTAVGQIPETQAKPFEGSPGLRVKQPNNEYEAFRIFMKDDLLELIVRETNLYAAEVQQVHPNCNKPNFSLKRFTDIDKDELMIYFSILFLMGIVKKPTLQSYWTSDHFLATPIFSRLMSRDRFLTIRRVIHFSDNRNMTEGKLFKIRPVFDMVQQTCQKVYTPTQNVVIDEILEGWKGRLGWKQYIPAKRQRFGIKLFLMCESESSYVSNLQVYVGRTTDVNLEISLDYGLYSDLLISTRVVIYLMSDLLNKGYMLVVDNWYTSPELFIVLKELGTNALGTVRTNRKLLPADFSSSKPKKGEVLAWKNDEGLLATKWNDANKKSVKIVSMLSSHVGK